MKAFTFIILLIFISHLAGQNLSENELIHYISNKQDQNLTQILQLGDFNQAEVNTQQISLIQTGNNQEFYYYDSTLSPSNIHVEMNGTNNYLEILGSNSIIENMQLRVEGDYRSIIINNYP